MAAKYFLFAHFISMTLVSGDGRDYTVIPTKMSWNDASNYCSEIKGTSLATIITDEDMTNLMFDYDVTNITSTDTHIWVGINDIDSPNEWEWESQQDCFSETNKCTQFWKNDEPIKDKYDRDCGFYYYGQNAFGAGICETKMWFACDTQMLTEVPTFTDAEINATATRTDAIFVIIIGGLSALICAGSLFMWNMYRKQDNIRKGGNKLYHDQYIDNTAAKQNSNMLRLNAQSSEDGHEAIVLATPSVPDDVEDAVEGQGTNEILYS